MTLTIREGDLIHVDWGGAQRMEATVIQVSGTWIVIRPKQSSEEGTPSSEDRLTVHFGPLAEQTCVAGHWRAWSDSEYTLQLQTEEPAEQRRSYFRSAIQLSLALHRETEIRILLLEDLSGGGCRCRIEPGDGFDQDEIHVGSLNLDDGEAPLKLDLRVVRVEERSVAFCFSVITEKDRQRVLQTLFRQYRAQRAAAQSSPSEVDGVPR